MKQISTHRHIAAPPEAVWALLTDPAALMRIGTGITRLDGRIAEGETIALCNEIAGDRVFRIKVSAVAPPARMLWSSGTPGIFRGVREFTLRATDGGTDFAMVETYRGLMLPLIWRSLPDMQPSFDTFSAALAAAAEGRQS